MAGNGGNPQQNLANANASPQNTLYYSRYYQHAFKDAAQHACQLYPDITQTMLQLSHRVSAYAKTKPADETNLHIFEGIVKKELTKILRERAATPISRFEQRLNEIKGIANAAGQPAQPAQAAAAPPMQQQQQAQQLQAQHQAQYAQQQQAQAQQQYAQQQQIQAQQQYAQQQYAQQQYAAQQQMMQQQQQQQQGHPPQQQQAQPPQPPPQQYPQGTAGMPTIQQLYNGPPSNTMYNQQVHPQLAAGMPGAGHPQMATPYPPGMNPIAVAQQPQRKFQAASSTPLTAATGSQPQGKPPKAPKGKRAAEGDAGAGAGAGGGGGGEEGNKAAAKRAKPAPASRKKKGQDSDADEDAADKFIVGDELLVDLQAETDAAMEGIDSRRRRQLPSVPGGQSWDDGYQYLSAWRLTNEVLIQRKEKMPGAAALSGPSGVVEFLEPSMLRALQLGFTAHAAEVLRRAAHAAKHRASSSAAQRRPEFVASGEDARRGLGEIRRAAEKIAADKAALEREELMKKAQSKRADEETRERAQKARAEMAGQQQATAANKAIAATLGGGKGAKWSKWSGAGAAGAATAAGKGKRKADASAEKASDTPADGGDGDGGTKSNLASSRSRGDLLGAGTAAVGGASAGAGTGADGLESTDIQLQDLIVALQQDSTYCKSTVLYRLLNGMN